MRFGWDDEQQLLRETVEAIAVERAGRAEFRRHAEPGAGYDMDLWHAIGRDLGLAGLTISDEYGGAGAGAVELAIVMEATGRSLAPSPLFATLALGAAAIAASGDTAAMAEYLPRIASGETTATLAHFEDPQRGEVQTRAERSDAGWMLTGMKRAVVDGATADLLIVTALDGDDLRLFVVDGVDAERVPSTVLDTTRPLATVRLDATPATPLAGGEEALARALRSASLALAAESLGVAQWCLDTSVAYARTRVQFDRPIGSFQAIKHKLADMLMDVEAARAGIAYATWSLDQDLDDIDAVAPLTAASISDAARRVASQTLQILGGIGYTWDHDAHFYFKRATASAQLLGSAASQREAALAAMGI
ncbi:MAG: acyl-CoA dehydrogenase family protein [Microbacterium sp.]